MDKITTNLGQNRVGKDIAQISQALVLNGKPNRISKLSLYCDSVSPELKRILQVDQALCQFWRSFLQPGFSQDREPPPVLFHSASPAPAWEDYQALPYHDTSAPEVTVDDLVRNQAKPKKKKSFCVIS